MRYQPPFALPSDFELAVACCRWAGSRRDGHTSDAVRDLARHVDWAAFLSRCRRHRVQSLAWHTLSRLDIAIDPSMRSALEGDSRAIAENGLRSAAHSKRIADGFAAAGIPLLFLKGLTLSKLAYGDAFLKMGGDIDILVEPNAIMDAAAILENAGYRVAQPARPTVLARWHRMRKESVWTHPDGLMLDLHSRLADQPQLLPGVTASGPSQTVSVAPGIQLVTLADAELFAYLGVHGASSAWFRLKWISDIAAFCDKREPDELDHLFGRARHLGAGRAIGQALILAQWLFKLSLSEPLQGMLRGKAERWLARTALGEMLRAEPRERRLGTRMIHATQFRLLPGWRYRMAELLRQARIAARPI